MAHSHTKQRLLSDLCLQAKTHSQLTKQGLPLGEASLSITTQFAHHVESPQERLMSKFAAHTSQTETCLIS